MTLSERIRAASGNVCSGCDQLIEGNYEALRQHRVYSCDGSARKARWLANPERVGKVLA